jgi:hypothetical protein
MRNLGIGMLLATFVAAGAVSASASTHHKGTSKKSASAAGTIQAFDSSGHTLSLKTSKGTSTFKVADGTQVWIGSKSGGTDDLGKYTGDRATVKYTASGGEMVASTVRVTPPSATHTKS